MGYFRLNQSCILVEGKDEGSVYNLLNGRTYPLSHDETKILKLLELGKEMKETSEILQIPEHDVSSLITKLEKENVGVKLQKSYVMDKIKIIPPLQKLKFFESPPPASRLYIEINNKCDKGCWFCGYYGIKRSMGCIGCNIWKESDEKLGTEEIKNIAIEAKKLGFNQVCLTGGDLFQDIGVLRKACSIFLNNNFIVFVTISSLHLNSSNFHTLKDMEHENLNYVFQIPLIENDKKEKLAETIDIAKRYLKTKTLIFNVIYKLSDIVEDSHEFLNIKNMLGDSKVNSYIEIVDKDGFKNLTERERKILVEGKIQPTDIFRYSHNVEYNPCLGGTLFIAHDGQVYPCGMLRNHPVGNIREQNLSEIVKGRLEKFWKLTKDNIAPCQDCSLRYACYECRAVEESLTNDISSTALCPRR